MNQKAEEAEKPSEKPDRDFSPSERADLRRVAKAWRSWEALGLGLRWFVTVVGLTAAGLTSVAILAKAFKDWITS